MFQERKFCSFDERKIYNRKNYKFLQTSVTRQDQCSEPSFKRCLLPYDVKVAARTLGDVVRKLGEKVLPEIIPILEKGLESDRSDQRQVRIWFVCATSQKRTTFSLKQESSLA